MVTNLVSAREIEKVDHDELLGFQSVQARNVDILRSPDRVFVVDRNGGPNVCDASPDERSEQGWRSEDAPKDIGLVCNDHAL